MPATTAHESACKYICLSGNARVVGESMTLDSAKPHNYSTLCEWQLAKEEPLSMIVTHYTPAGPAEVGSVISAAGELKFVPGDSEAEVDASSFYTVTKAEHAHHSDVKPPGVCAVGQVEFTEGRNWCLSVATYDRVARTHKTFTIEILVPPTGRFANLRTPVKGTLVSVRGILSGVSTSEVAAIDLEAVTFISITNMNRPSIGPSSVGSPALAPGSIGRTKRQRRQAQESAPSKKIRIGPPSMFMQGDELAEFTGESNKENDESIEPCASGSGTA
ncbi:hypothetical protein FRC08_000624 [Ceratobasidium sp. 394]|nr:hypothetical protein FRC08_000624 [Ceratobasidium sp. 394]